MKMFCFHLKKKPTFFLLFPTLKGGRGNTRQSSKWSFSIQVNMLFSPKLFLSSTEVPNQLFAQLCSQVSPMPGRAKGTTWRREKTKAEQGHQHGSPELSRTGEADTVALVIRSGGTREAGEAAELGLHGWKRGFPGRKEWGRTRSRAGWVATPRNRRS